MTATSGHRLLRLLLTHRLVVQEDLLLVVLRQLLTIITTIFLAQEMQLILVIFRQIDIFPLLVLIGPEQL